MLTSENRKHRLETLVAVLSLGTLLFLNPQVKSPIETAEATDFLFSDSFEDGNFDQWDVQDNAWSVKSISGSKRFGGEISSPNQSTHATAGDASWADYSFDVDIYAESGSDKNLMFRYRDVNNKYGLHLVNFQDHRFDGICLEKWVNGSFSDKCTWPVPIYNSTAIPVRILVIGTAVRVYVNNSAIFDEPNWGPIDSGKIGLRIAPGANFPAKVWYDNVIVKRLSSFPTPLPVPPLKQSSDPWGPQIYDRAPEWAPPAPPTIARWGCAITSAAMTFLFHGINKGPDNLDVTPSSINTWLLAQPDGYIGRGNVNWWALRRFTRIANTQYGSPILDFRKTTSFDSSLLDTYLSNHQPDIIGVDQNSHFVVATGQSIGTYFINDPYYPKTELSEYSVVNSMMHYYPTSTNLSAIYMVANPSVELYLTNPNSFQLGKKPLTGELFIPTETNYDLVPPMTDEESRQTSGPGYQELAFPLPQDSPYTLSAWSNSLTPYNLELIGYNQNGEPFIKNISGVTDTNFPSLVNFSFSQTDTSRIQSATRFVTFESLRTDIRLARKLSWITDNKTEKRLLKDVEVLERSTPHEEDEHEHQEGDEKKESARKIYRDISMSFKKGKINQQAVTLLTEDLTILGFSPPEHQPEKDED